MFTAITEEQKPATEKKAEEAPVTLAEAVTGFVKSLVSEQGPSKEAEPEEDEDEEGEDEGTPALEG